MIPLKDMTPRRSVPIITLLLIAANVAVFAYQLSLPPKPGKIHQHVRPGPVEDAPRAGGPPLHSFAGFSPADHVHVSPRRISPHHRQYVVPLDFRWERGRPARLFRLFTVYFICGIGSGLRRHFFVGVARAVSRRERGYIGRSGCVPHFLSRFPNPNAGATFHNFLPGANPGVCVYRPVVRRAISERTKFTGIREQRGRCVVGARRRFLAGCSFCTYAEPVALENLRDKLHVVVPTVRVEILRFRGRYPHMRLLEVSRISNSRKSHSK